MHSFKAPDVYFKTLVQPLTLLKLCCLTSIEEILYGLAAKRQTGDWVFFCLWAGNVLFLKNSFLLMEITFEIVAGNQVINQKGGTYYVYVIMMNLGCHFDQDNRAEHPTKSTMEKFNIIMQQEILGAPQILPFYSR